METFDELGLTPEILATLKAISFTTPTPIQSKTIPVMLENARDVIGLAQTGTGKTAAYGLPIIQLAKLHEKHVQALILCPTRELCMQITKDMDSYKGENRQFKTVAVYGGANILIQIKALKEGCQVVVGTPGRVLDLMRRKVLKLDNISFLVLDEADEMLNMGFLEDIHTVLEATPDTKRTHLFSATMPPEIQKIAEKFMRNTIEISVGRRNEGAADVKHIYYIVNSKNRFEALTRVADLNPRIYGIIFCRTRQETKDVAEKMISHGYNADALHGDLSQAQRDHVMHRFRSGNLQMLVATDVAARGLDVNDLSHIINYNLPDDNEVYLHRSGRTGRAGKSGVSISIITPRDQKRIRDIERLIGKSFKAELLPSGKDICQKQLFSLIDIVEKVEVNEEQIADFLPVIYKKLDWLSREDLIKRFVSVEFNRFLDLYKNAPDINAEDTPKRERGKREDNHKKGAFVCLKINLGKINNITPPRLIGLINDTARTRDIKIGKINIMQGFSLIEVEDQYAVFLLNSLNKATYDGNRVSAAEDTGPKKDKTGKEDSSHFRHKETRERNHYSKDSRDNKFRKGDRDKSSGYPVHDSPDTKPKKEKHKKSWEIEMEKARDTNEKKKKKFK